MEQLGGGCFTPARASIAVQAILSLKCSRWTAARTERIETDVKTIEQAREQGRQLQGRAQDLIDDAYQQLGIKQ
ncbi:MAG: hypothetical protein MZV63_17300 [Marinilabiliales bacterium]|nr:hypothetical protein [Marinilabiliales bacterium]